MKIVIALLAVAASFPGWCGAAAETAAAAAQPIAIGGASDPGGSPQPDLAAGANSFTESQARSRLEGGGFRDVVGLHRDRDGIWRAVATKEGRAVSVALDYRGNVASP